MFPVREARESPSGRRMAGGGLAFGPAPRPELVTRYFSLEDLTKAGEWRLLAWCAAHGGSEFTVRPLVDDHESERLRHFFLALRPLAQSRRPRRVFSAVRGEHPIQSVHRWRLDDTSMGFLRRVLPMGYAAQGFDHDLWLEDLAVYRGFEPMMAVLTRAGGGLLRVTENELREASAEGFPVRETAPWMVF